MASWEDNLKAIYYDSKHPACFAGPQKLYKVVTDEGIFNIGIYTKSENYYTIRKHTVFINRSGAVSKTITS